MNLATVIQSDPTYPLALRFIVAELGCGSEYTVRVRDVDCPVSLLYVVQSSVQLRQTLVQQVDQT